MAKRKKTFGKKIKDAAKQAKEYITPSMAEHVVNNDMEPQQVHGILVGLYSQYRSDKSDYDGRLVENNEWYATRHYEIIKADFGLKDSTEPKIAPVSNYLFSTLSTKHASMMDHYPGSNFLPEEKDDIEEAKRLTNIVPIIYKRAEFKEEYRRSMWTMLKSGSLFWCAYWDEEAEDGLGDIKVKKIDPLRIYFNWQQSNIQNSEAIITWSEMPESTFKRTYKVDGATATATGTDIDRYKYEKERARNRIIFDAYYKDENGNVQFMKWSGGDILYWSVDDENHPEYKENGYYEMGIYPIVHVLMFPEEEIPVGFGYVDVLKNPQTYIDLMDKEFLRNIARSAKQRYVVNKTADPQLKADLMNYATDVVEYKGAGTVKDAIMPIQDRELSGNAISYRDRKIEELKETSNTGEFARGETGGGVTAATAIMALQEASNKIDRDVVDAVYEGKLKLDYIIIGLIRQFYGIKRSFRIAKPAAGIRDKTTRQAVEKAGVNNIITESPEEQGYDFVEYDNEGLKPKEVVQGEFAYQRTPHFDIEIRPEKESPYARAATNETAKELLNMGFFRPDMAEQALIALSMMSFDGKEDIMIQIQAQSQMFQQLQAMQQLNQQLAADNQMLGEATEDMNEAVKGQLGINLLDSSPVEEVPVT